MRSLVIPNWRRAWRMASVQLAALAVLFGSLPADAQASILDMIGVPAARERLCPCGIALRACQCPLRQAKSTTEVT